MKISDNFKLMRVTATQMIAHCSVNFDPIQNFFKSYHWILSEESFKIIASVVVLVGVAKNCKRFLVILV